MIYVMSFFQKLGPEMLTRTYEHIYLTLTAMAIATAVALPLGIYLAKSRSKKLAGIVIGIASVIQTIPSLALIAFIVLLFALASLPTIGAVPALVALVLYAILPIVRNTYTGIRQVDPAIVEVARGMGMKPSQVLFSVELPLSLPVIIAGIRIATVWTIGIATLCGLIGAGGLGDLIMKGLRSVLMDYLLAGTIPAAVLAVFFDGTLGYIEKQMTSRWKNPDEKRSAKYSQKFLKRLRLFFAGVLLILLIILVLRTCSKASGSLRAGFSTEFLTRPDGYPGLIEHYVFSFPSIPVHLDPGLIYNAAAEGAVDVIDGYSTDGRIPAYNLVMLEDDRDYFPAYHAAPLIREETLKKFPELETILSRLANAIQDTVMQRLNYAVDELGVRTYDAARTFLLMHGLIEEDYKPGTGTAGTIVIGGKPFTEQDILGEMLSILIEYSSDIEVVRKLNLGGTIICFNAIMHGDLDLYVEYSGTGLVDILKKKVIKNPEQVYKTVKKMFREKYSLIWLSPFGFNNTYTLTMRRDHAKKLGITRISELAAHINKEKKD